MKTISGTLTVFAVTALAGLAFAAGGKDSKKGEDLFRQHCMACHADGGNIINPAKTIGKETLKASGISDWKGIVKVMRNPGPGMTKFDVKAVPDKDAKLIAEYILKTFK
ncbi:c-type cytochrome [Geobacter benzoatilyticus]|uniref:C-type cytochrome n=1 Tax=Geobacter benzoatilyticus TaxID=2815309 RepID=A0ABX7Q2W6_9BACT|nr:c-type cytochrome [Geobacter benzoatilyticus]QSV45793.1 c-type cytochrome [Geobacter benzoatilyticus]